MFELKEYQKETLGILREYLEQASLQGRLFQILPEYAQRFLLIFLQLKHGGAPNGP